MTGLRCLLAAACLAFGSVQGHGAAAQPGGVDQGVCLAAADEAERSFGLPAGMLRAIGMIESGRWQPLLNRSAPWPYAIDAGGYSLFMDGLADAVEKVRALRRDGIESIDVGCFQVNLMFHPAAFATLEEAFDPRANAAYAARFLLSLYARSGTWAAAVAGYHSGVPSVGEPYRARVYAAWQGGDAWQAGASPDSSAPIDLHAPQVRMSIMRVMAAPSSGVRVYVPTVFMVSAPLAAARPIGVTLKSTQHRLPVVFTPTLRRG